jgi:hypothetical protein
MNNSRAKQGKKNKDIEKSVSVASPVEQCVAQEQAERNARNVKIA